MSARPSRRPLVAMLVASGVSLVGTRLSAIALPLFVLITTGSPLRTGVVAFAEMAPYVVVQGLAGPLTDRVGPRRVSIVCDLLSAVVVSAIPVLYALGQLTFGWLLVLVAAAGLVRGPGDISKYVMAPAVASATGQPRERVLGLADGVSRASSIIGPIGAAALVVVIGAPAALAVDAASFAVCALIVATLVPRTIGQPVPDAEEDGLTYLHRLRSGARFLRQDGLLRSIVGMVATTNLLDAALATVLLAVWARSRGGGAGLMGAVSATMAAGAVIGAVAAAIYGHRLPRRATFGWGFFLIGGPRFLVLASGAPLWVVLSVIFVGGIGAGTINPILAAVELERIPEHLRGRVMALINSAAWALIPFGGLVGGLLSERLGVSAALAICGVLYAIATTLPALRPEWRAMDRRPVPRESVPV